MQEVGNKDKHHRLSSVGSKVGFHGGCLSYIRYYITPPPYHDKVLDQAFFPGCVVSKAVDSFTSTALAMARPQEANVAVTGITVLNPELTPNETLVEYASQPCDK